MTVRQCSSCGGFCKKSGCERENVQPEPKQEQGEPTRYELQAKGEHPAPCARFCEANAFKIEIKNLKLIIDAAKNDDMNRVIELAEKQQDKFCDNNCVWTDHHKDCVRAEQKPAVEVRLVAGGKPLFLMIAAPESFKDGDFLYTHPSTIDKSAAIRIATSLGWTPPRKPLTHEQRFDLLTAFEPHKNKWEAPAILIDLVEAAHGIKE